MQNQPFFLSKNNKNFKQSDPDLKVCERCKHETKLFKKPLSEAYHEYKHELNLSNLPFFNLNEDPNFENLYKNFTTKLLIKQDRQPSRENGFFIQEFASTILETVQRVIGLTLVKTDLNHKERSKRVHLLVALKTKLLDFVQKMIKKLMMMDQKLREDFDFLVNELGRCSQQKIKLFEDDMDMAYISFTGAKKSEFENEDGLPENKAWMDYTNRIKA